MMSNNEQFHQAFFYLISGLFSAESIFFLTLLVILFLNNVLKKIKNILFVCKYSLIPHCVQMP